MREAAQSWVCRSTADRALGEALPRAAKIASKRMAIWSCRMIYFAIACLASAAVFLEMADRAPELPWHD